MIEHIGKFKEIVEKYELFDEDKAQEIAHYITDHRKGGFSAEDFARDFALDIEDAKIFLSVVYKGVELHKRHVQGDVDGK